MGKAGEQGLAELTAPRSPENNRKALTVEALIWLPVTRALGGGGGEGQGIGPVLPTLPSWSFPPMLTLAPKCPASV